MVLIKFAGTGTSYLAALLEDIDRMNELQQAFDFL